MTYISALTKQLAELGSNLKPGVPSTIGVRNEMVAKAKELIDALSSPEQHVLQKGANVRCRRPFSPFMTSREG